MYKVSGVKIAKLISAVPKNQYTVLEYASDLLDEKAAQQHAKAIGFSKLRIAPEDMTVGNLFKAAAEKMLAGYDKSNIGGLVIVSHTPDYRSPSLGHVMQDVLGLPVQTLCLDINEGCSGYASGLYTSALMAKSMQKAVLLLGGDVISKHTHPKDSATRTIMGDAVYALLVEPGDEEIFFSFTSYGEKRGIIVEDNNGERKVENPRNEGKVYFDGVEIMSFVMAEVPPLIKATIEAAGLTQDDISLYAMHQANKMLLKLLSMKLKVAPAKMPFVVGETGNMSSACIPYLLTVSKDKDLSKVFGCGFGVGMSASCTIADYSKTEIMEPIEVEDCTPL